MRKVIGDFIWGRNPARGPLFDKIMLVVILLSLLEMVWATLPGLSLWTQNALAWFDTVFIILFTVEYLLRLWTAEKPLTYARSGWGLVDLAAILPFWLALGANFEVLRSLRLLRLLRVLKLARHVAAINRIGRAFTLVKEELAVFGLLALIFMFIASVGIYEFEHEAQPEAFASIPHSFWFSIVTLTTVGYGDVYPITLGGRLFTAMMLLTGIGVIAVPTSLISAGLARAREEERVRKQPEKTGQAAGDD